MSGTKSRRVDPRRVKKIPSPTPAVADDTVEAGRGPPAGQVRIAAIGASAGGLEALERFFQAMPVDSGLAFVIIQHLSPDFRSMMDELLARQSRMTIRHAVNGLLVEANTVYLNPPRQNLLIINGQLFLKAPDASEIPNHPIDAFFTSLSTDRGASAIGVILSGTGTDGTKGALSILQHGGTVLVQEPGSAKFENMPRNAVEKHAATATALPEEMPALLVRISQGQPLDQRQPEDEQSIEPDMAILRLLEKRFGANFGYYKKSTVGRRIARRAALNGIDLLSDYAQLLRADTAELDRLYADLLIGVTAFFRDRAAFDALASEAIPRLVADTRGSRPIRIWVPGCASGEEAYSIAILFAEHARRQNLPLDMKIFATDLHLGSLDTASQGLYPAKSIKDISPEVRERYFDDVDGRFQAKASLRRLIVFSPHNIIKDPPFTRLDLVSCRNLLIYLDEAAQKKVLSLFHFSLVKDGILFLGPSETLGSIEDEFDTIDSRWRLYRKLRNVQLPGSTRLLPAIPMLDDLGAQMVLRQPALKRSSAAPKPFSRSDRRQLLQAYDAVLARHAPPSLLVTRSGELVHVFGDAQKYLRLKSGLFSSRLADIVIEPLKLAVTACLDGLHLHDGPAVARETTFRQDDKDVIVQVRADAMEDSGLDPEYALIALKVREPLPSRPSTRAETIERVGERAALQGRVDELERNLQFSEESLQATIEELETSNEELQSTNEELMSANEELQSTNEELHAVNEELYSVSSEHQRKIDELTTLTNDMDHLLRCTDVGTVFIDEELRIRRFTPSVAKAFNLLDRDIGRPIDHITARFAYPELARDVASVAATARIIERLVDVDDLSLLLRIFPFQVEGRTRGVVLTLIDVPRLKQAERALEARNSELARVNASLQQFTYIVSHDLRAPLRTMLNSAKWIEEDLGDAANEQVRNHCTRLMTYSRRLTEMLDDLMIYARLDIAERVPEMIDVNALVGRIAESLDTEGHVSLVCRGSVPPFSGYRAPLTLVFQNLVDNAIKYADKPAVEITVTAEDLGPHFRFAVSDNGPGIPPRHHEKIFLPFRKLEHKDNKPGTGMGLALVRKAVNDNGGEIEVLSEPDVRPGTTFRFSWGKLGTVPMQTGSKT